MHPKGQRSNTASQKKWMPETSIMMVNLFHSKVESMKKMHKYVNKVISYRSYSTYLSFFVIPNQEKTASYKQLKVQNFRYYAAPNSQSILKWSNFILQTYLQIAFLGYTCLWPPENMQVPRQP